MPTKAKIASKKTTRLIRKSAASSAKEIKFPIESDKEFRGSHLLPVIDASSIVIPVDEGSRRLNGQALGLIGGQLMNVIIKSGIVVTPGGAAVMDVAIEGEKIAAVATPGTLSDEHARVIDATGKIVLPGGIEPHTHINVPIPDYWAGGRSEVFTLSLIHI